MQQKKGGFMNEKHIRWEVRLLKWVMWIVLAGTLVPVGAAVFLASAIDDSKQLDLWKSTAVLSVLLFIVVASVWLASAIVVRGLQWQGECLLKLNEMIRGTQAPRVDDTSAV